MISGHHVLVSNSAAGVFSDDTDLLHAYEHSFLQLFRAVKSTVHHRGHSAIVYLKLVTPHR